jgi:signal transduction histidine kinase
MSQALVLIYFCYGLAFLAMGLAVLLEAGRSPGLAAGRGLRYLAAFGIIHGTHEWLESYLLQSQALGASSPAWVVWLKIGLLVASFIALFFYAYVSLRLTSPKYQGRTLLHFDRLLVYEVVVVLVVGLTYQNSPVQWQTLLDGLARYLLAIPAAALAGLALYAQARGMRRDGRVPLARALAACAVGFAVYAAAQIFVRPMNAFPAQYLNQDVFSGFTGIPIQAIRTLAAIVITVGILRATQLLENERQAQLAAAHRARLAALEERDALRRELLEHVVRSQEDERARIARELHDEIAQLLSAFSLELAAMKSTLKDPDAKRLINHLQGLSREMSQSLYRLVRDLRPSQLDDLGLAPALRSYIAQDCLQKGLEVEFNVCGDQARLDPLVETAVFRVVQEALTNVSRHSGVHHARVELDYSRDQLVIHISDEGAGFDPSEQFHPPRGWGLAGMRERVESLAGHLTLQSVPGQGTSIEVVIPLMAEVEKEFADGTHQTTPGR